MEAHRPDGEPAAVSLFLMTMTALVLHRQGWSWEEIRAAFDALTAAVTLWLTTQDEQGEQDT
ncbi:hypothetical protein [Streptomyces sp. NPDC003247]|uniref:hypothetical protein n=1 Tax=Streptomyces sp. NPDC003247 TaxID=3364677 RepID=UPI0036B94DA7